VKALIVNGDDFGLTPGVNAGILAAHTRGILTSASLFANAPATAGAIRIAARTPSLGVGCHLALVDATPVLPADRLPTLAPEACSGRFRPTWGSFIAAALAGRIRPAEIEQEVAAQLDRLTSSGLALTHVDGHKHVHTYPPIFEIVARLARRFGIRSVRVPCEAKPFARIVRHWNITVARRQAIENLALSMWAAADRRILARHGMTPAPHFHGRTVTGLLTSETLRTILTSLPPGTSELMTHPGYVDAALEGIHTRLRQQRLVELDALTDPAVAELVAEEEIILSTHNRFVREPRSYAS
jgi:hopanoid biosynthesis associated protein HpnK